jgi:hypothetical protein
MLKVVIKNNEDNTYYTSNILEFFNEDKVELEIDVV